jgi:expansin (peptidoglycan-binding protein)
MSELPHRGNPDGCENDWVVIRPPSVEVSVITERPWVAIAERPWLAGGLISAATTIVILGLIVVTQPRGTESEPRHPSLIVAASPTPAGAVVAKTTVTPTATVSPKAAAKPKPKATAEKAKSKQTKTSRTTQRGASGPGTGRIQFGRTYTGRATFYAATGAGNCSFEASGDLMVGAMNQRDYANSQACGAHLSVTGPKGTVTIRIVDRCPECPPGAIDLSRQAFAKIAPVSAGRVSISWHLLSPSGLGPVSYRYKTGSSQYWCGIQVRNHRNPVRSLQVKTGNTWKSLERQDYNYFISAGGSGCGGAIRVTDIYGNQLTDTGIKISPDRTQRGTSQFPAR